MLKEKFRISFIHLDIITGKYAMARANHASPILAIETHCERTNSVMF